MLKKIQQYGTILKRETLSTASLSFQAKELILTSNDPFPGFYCSEEMLTDNSCKENSFYLPIHSLAEQEDNLCRFSIEIQEKESLTVCPAIILLDGEYTPAFRAKEIKEEQLKDVVDFFREKGIAFQKHREVKSYLSRINLKNFFELNELSEGIYQNKNSENLYYFLIPEKIKWVLFEKLITYQKSNTDFTNFDAAIGYWMLKPKFIDFVRVYGNNLTIEQLQGIHKNFLTNIKAYKNNRILI